MELRLSPKKIVQLLAWIVIVLSILSVLGQVYKYFFFNGENRYLIDMINLDKEQNFPTYYATLSLLFCSLLLYIISYGKRLSMDKFSLHWFILSIIFFILSMDEILQLHEQIISPLRSILNTSGYFYFAWTIPAIIFGIIFIIAYFRFLFNLPAVFRNLFIIAGILYVTGAVGLEIVSSKFISQYGEENFSYSLITTVEEIFEMVGVLLFIYTLLFYLNSGLVKIKIVFAQDRKNTK